MSDTYFKKLQLKISKDNLEKAFNSLKEWSIDNFFMIIAFIIIICLEWVVCYYIFTTIDPKTGNIIWNSQATISLFVGLLAVTSAFYMNYFTNKKSEENITKQINISKFAFDETNRIKSLAKLKKDFDHERWNEDNIRKFVRAIKFQKEHPEVFYTLFTESKEKYNSIKEDVRNFCYMDQKIFTQFLRNKNYPDELIYDIPNPKFKFAFIIWKEIIKNIYYEERDEFENPEAPELIEREKLYNEIDYRSYYTGLFETTIKGYIYGGTREFLDGIPQDNDKSYETRDLVNYFYSCFLDDITNFNNLFADELENIWKKYITT